jgi:hypothetical protein
VFARQVAGSEQQKTDRLDNLAVEMQELVKELMEKLAE